MKRLIKKIKCAIFGHKWVFMHVYGIRAHIKCQNCEIHKDVYIHEILDL